MNDVENTLSPQLHRLADDLVPGDAGVSADAVLTTYRHRRRARAGIVAVAAVVALVGVGVPTLFAVVGADQPTGHHQSATGDPGPSSPSASATSSADPRRADLEQVAAALTSSYRLAAPARWVTAPNQPGDCPAIDAALSRALGTPMTFWNGRLPHWPEGCQYAPAGSTAPDSTLGTRFSVNIGFLGGMTVEQMRRGPFTPNSDCVQVDVRSAGLPEALDRCEFTPGRVVYHLYVADSHGAGVWALSTAGDGTFPGVTPAQAVTAVADAAQQVFGG